ncbi:MAG: hypothetical protein KA184_11810 [Candidatus Hydrogenedentes bacterium]|nr:hypothetical protein [Candidatus Hydrogenedentota bacterium]
MNKHTINGLIPQGFALAHDAPLNHPINPVGRGGSLVQCEATGIYCLLVGGAVMSVPQRWAREMARGQRLTVAVFAEHCPAAGLVCHDVDRIESGSWDVVTYEGTRAQLLGHADRLDALARTAGAGRDVFLRRCAQSIREAAG